MTGAEFRRIREGLLMTQEQLAARLGYRQSIRISEYERQTNPIPIPDHIARVMLALRDETPGRRVPPGRLIRDWTPPAEG